MVDGTIGSNGNNDQRTKSKQDIASRERRGKRRGEGKRGVCIHPFLHLYYFTTATAPRYSW